MKQRASKMAQQLTVFAAEPGDLSLISWSYMEGKNKLPKEKLSSESCTYMCTHSYTQICACTCTCTCIHLYINK